MYSIARMLAVAACAALLGGAAEARCSDYGKVRSLTGEGEKVPITFVNRRSEAVEVYWIDYDGSLRLKESLAPGERVDHRSYPTHPFIMLSADGRCRGLTVIRRAGDRVVAR